MAQPYELPNRSLVPLLAPKQKNLAELRAENRLIKTSYWANSLAAVITTSIKYGVLAFGLYMAYLSILALSGKHTDAMFALSVFGNITISKALAYVFGGGGIIYGGFQQRARKRMVERLGPRVKELETGIDPARSSSELTPRGENQPKDRVG